MHSSKTSSLNARKHASKLYRSVNIRIRTSRLTHKENQQKNSIVEFHRNPWEQVRELNQNLYKLYNNFYQLYGQSILKLLINVGYINRNVLLDMK